MESINSEYLPRAQKYENDADKASKSSTGFFSKIFGNYDDNKCGSLYANAAQCYTLCENHKKAAECHQLSYIHYTKNKYPFEGLQQLYMCAQSFKHNKNLFDYFCTMSQYITESLQQVENLNVAKIGDYEEELAKVYSETIDDIEALKVYDASELSNNAIQHYTKAIHYYKFVPKFSLYKIKKCKISIAELYAKDQEYYLAYICYDELFKEELNDKSISSAYLKDDYFMWASFAKIGDMLKNNFDEVELEKQRKKYCNDSRHIQYLNNVIETLIKKDINLFFEARKEYDELCGKISRITSWVEQILSKCESYIRTGNNNNISADVDENDLT